MSEQVKKRLARVNWQLLAIAGLLLALFILGFSVVQYGTTGLAGNDGYYGAKIASILLPSLAFLAIWWLLRTQKVPYAVLWSLGLFAVSEAFLYRMSMPRAQSAALLLLILGLHWLLQGRYKRLLPLGFIFVWTYNAFPLLLILAGVYVTAVFLSARCACPELAERAH